MNREAYNRIAPQWDAARNGFFGRERDYLDALLEGLAPGSAILDAGCGAGRPLGAEVLARGHSLTGVDQCEALLVLARARLPAGRFVLCPLEDYAFAERFQAVICWDTLFHIPRRLHPDLLGRMARCLAPGGRLMLTVGGSDHPAFTDLMFGEEFFYDSLPPDQVLALLEGLGLRVAMAEFMNPPTDGRDKGRYAIVARLG